MENDKFTNSDYIGTSDLPFNSERTQRKFLGITWQQNVGLDKYRKSTDNKTPIFAWHKDAVVMGTNLNKISTQYNPVSGAWEILAKLSAGGSLIHPDGVIKLNWTSKQNILMIII